MQFSNDPDLSVKECHKLLKEFMPDHIQETKITQKLFIRLLKKYIAITEIRLIGGLMFDRSYFKKV